MVGSYPHLLMVSSYIWVFSLVLDEIVTNRTNLYILHLCWLSFTLLGGQEADREGDHILSQGVGDDPKVQDGEDLIPEKEVDGQGAHQKPGIVDLLTLDGKTSFRFLKTPSAVLLNDLKMYSNGR